MVDVPSSQVVKVRLRLVDVWGGDDVVRELSLAELETSERGVAVGSTFYPWRRLVSYEWEVVEHAGEGDLPRLRQLLVRVLTTSEDGGAEEHRVPADRFEVGPWSISMLVPDRVEPESERAVFRRVTVPWHRVLEYERMLAEASIGTQVPLRPDIEEADPALVSGEAADDVIVIDVEPAAATAAATGSDGSPTATEPAGARTKRQPASRRNRRSSKRSPVPAAAEDAVETDRADEAVEARHEGSDAIQAEGTDEREPVGAPAGGPTAAKVAGSVPRKTGQRRRRAPLD